MRSHRHEPIIVGQGYCKKHGRTYAVLIGGGCPVCMREAGIETPASKRAKENIKYMRKLIDERSK